ncbi:hypothetical protein AMES_8849 [Amycolatopsis mediterranei S699]|uniref:DUF2339 domain-containing protein n=2 Tax=Amycolatopsis mediterranei TaxID=33910 RepID=A0A0H3DIH3_AMYMU|nr:DUF2339 domain-containing protein [Amycolatopsis mediterranei]ADJ50675.1 conserved hypothetical protein [Amycolatopsis mediterranei U32]AEK47683.1 hypothetical protein RAM_46090 [Amycolatopsis mediterranei S699]AFO82381.1 hypothetical protein AMES_8849 [Amycolatopsis mediterranei S699]KDO12332.1 hypothetical protein DV26_04555 [Amycolatopsis mediterranei]KDU91538.1 hypothetical protein DV36_15865 [Amycolatopsis mediterranei]
MTLSGMTTDADVLLRLAGEIDDLGRRLALVGSELRTVREDTQPEEAGHAEPAQAEQPPQPEQAPQPQPQPEPRLQAQPQPQPQPRPMRPESVPWPQYQWQPPPQQQYVPPQQHYAPAPSSYLPAPRPTLGEKLGREGAGSRVLAWVGGAVTLLGVVLLLVLAVQRGWLGPLPRVLVGAGFGLALTGTGVWLHRKPTGRTGAFALAATGIATLYLDVVAATTLYEFLPVLAGLAAGLAVAVGGLLVAVRWESPLLAAAVVIGCVVCSPMIVRGFTPELVTFLLMVQLATAPVQLRRDWPSLTLSAGIPPLLASVISTAWLGGGGSWANTAAAGGAAVASVGLGLIVLRRRENDPAALSLLATAVVPTLVAAMLLPKAQAVPITAGAGVVLLAVWAARRWWPGFAGQVAGLAGLVAILQATVTQFDGPVRAGVLLGEALLLVVAAVGGRNRGALAAALGFAALGGLLGVAFDVTPALLIVPRAHSAAELAGALAVAALILAVSVVLPWAAVRLAVFRGPAEDLPIWLLAGISALYGAAGVVLCGALLAVAGRPGFLLGHALITVSWTIAALVLLLRGIDVVALRVTGLILVGAAVLKLVLFDLAALDGLARVGAFLGAGLVLLAAGTRYERRVATR